MITHFSWQKVIKLEPNKYVSGVFILNVSENRTWSGPADGRNRVHNHGFCLVTHSGSAGARFKPGSGVCCLRKPGSGQRSIPRPILTIPSGQVSLKDTSEPILPLMAGDMLPSAEGSESKVSSAVSDRVLNRVRIQTSLRVYLALATGSFSDATFSFLRLSCYI